MAKIVVIDDEPGIVRFIRRALEADGHAVHAAFDGTEGLRVASEVNPELVVLDLLMPGVSGMGVLAALLADRPAPKVLVLSAVGDVSARVRCLDIGAADFLGKPFASALPARRRERSWSSARSASICAPASCARAHAARICPSVSSSSCTT